MKCVHHLASRISHFSVFSHYLSGHSLSSLWWFLLIYLNFKCQSAQYFFRHWICLFFFFIYTHSLGNTIQVGHLVICTPGPDICPELQICWSNCWLDIATWMLNRWLNINMSPNLLLPIIHIWQRQLYFFNSSDKKTMTLLFLDSISDSFINPFGYVFRLFFWNLTISLTQHRFPPEVLEYFLPHLPSSVLVSL